MLIKKNQDGIQLVVFGIFLHLSVAIYPWYELVGLAILLVKQLIHLVHSYPTEQRVILDVIVVL